MRGMFKLFVVGTALVSSLLPLAAAAAVAFMLWMAYEMASNAGLL